MVCVTSQEERHRRVNKFFEEARIAPTENNVFLY